MKGKLRLWGLMLAVVMSMGLVFSACTNQPSGEEGENGGGETKNVLTLSHTELAGRPGETYYVTVEDWDGEEIEVTYAAKKWFTAVATDDGRIEVAYTDEGEATITVSMGGYEPANLILRSLDLDFDMNEHIDVGEKGEQLKLTHDVNASYSLQGEGAVISDGRLKAVSQGIFYLTAEYGEIKITKMFESYAVHPEELDELPRESAFIEYHGRNVHTGGSVIMNNIGSGFTVRFYGTELFADFDAWYGSWYGMTMISVLVDGETDTTKNVMTLNDSLRKTYAVVDGLEEGYHTVTVLKRTEALSTAMTLYTLKTDGEFLPLPKEEKLKMEVYGDSITAGYGNLRGDLADTTSSDYQSGLQTYATYAAAELGAEINVQAKTGIGLYTAGGSYEYQVADYYNYVNYDGEYEWNFDNYTPDIVVINLGTNDHWSTTTFNSSTYISKYVGLVTTLAGLYGENTAFVLASGLMEQAVDVYVQQVAEQLEGAIENPVYTIQFEQCAAGHPVWEEHLVAGQQLAQLIRSKGLDVIHASRAEESKSSEAGSAQVEFTFSVRTRDAIPEHVDLYAVGLGDGAVALTRSPEDLFVFSATVMLAEGDYDVRILADNDERYGEYADLGNAAHTVYVRSDRKSQQVTLNTFRAFPEAPDSDEASFGWSLTTHLFDASFTATSESEVAYSNTNWMAGFLTRKATLGDEYTVSATISWTGNSTADQVYIGLLPYYLDDHNYVVAYLQWNADGSFKGIGCTGELGGVNLGWNDYWSFAGLALQHTAGQAELAMTRRGTDLTISLLGVSEKRTFSPMKADNERIGIWIDNAQATCTNVKVEEAEPEAESQYIWELTSHLSESTLEELANDHVKTSTNDWLAGYAVRNSGYADNYTISAKITAPQDGYAAENDFYIGLVPYYEDGNNFVAVYLQWDASGAIKSMGCTGVIGGQSIGWNDMWGFGGIQTTLTQGQTLSVTRTGTRLTVSFAGVTDQVTIASLTGDTAKVGLWGRITTGVVDFSEITLTEYTA